MENDNNIKSSTFPTERLGASLNATLTSMTTGITSRQLEKSLKSLSTFPTERLGASLNATLTSMTTGITSRQLEKSLKSLSTFPT
ncbi:hypothetical protein, partial [Priestia flexa]|uniref:hypothetical protein n=1 Tax=Priestia flexa TaxID=86664 RepID=UPI001CFD6B7F